MNCSLFPKKCLIFSETQPLILANMIAFKSPLYLRLIFDYHKHYMIDPNFQPPEQEISKAETLKRKNLLPWIKDFFDNVTTGIFVGGSLSYGADYSVNVNSDIDVQLVLNDEALDQLFSLNFYKKEELEQALSGYKKGIYQQFSLVGEKDSVSIESHFWNKDAFIKSINYTNSETPRLRSSITTPSTDYGFSFDGTNDTVDFYGEIVEGYPVSPFPSFRTVDSKLYLCRPITTVLGGPIILKTDSDFDEAIELCWKTTIEHLKRFKLSAPNGVNATIVNALPSQYKMSPEVKAILLAKTQELLSS